MRIFITGASGCVGRYLVEEFLTETAHDLVLLVRDAGKMPVAPEHAGRVTLIEGDLRDLDRMTPHMDGVDVGILVATAWGGEDTYKVTVDANLALADALIAAGCGHVMFFGTASVLDGKGGMLAEAGEIGTDYIRAKFQLVQAIETRAAKARITGLYPTLVFGGRDADPAIRWSHFANLLAEAKRWTGLLRFLSADGLFHVIHAADIARVTRHLAERPATPGTERLVLGNPAKTVRAMVAAYCGAMGRRALPVLRLRQSWVPALARILPIQLAEWDAYCARHPDQSHAGAVNPASYGLPVHMPGITDGLRELGIARP
ncbi:NAD-dependent epimerase/dehydratase family protein [Anianabacter salinae]|uniref:NAD-dependent epimerase/dehydratase family protein n=1 Tax=Anianabacter salinae TaxID=2851023 RepID=UPI00225E37F4|nr:NAD(P)-dependent oxidoreductase [Anianabacter salinae]MBV0912358.1 NAD(P)-dependent oxidoreductase [Anianabacter salinae]